MLWLCWGLGCALLIGAIVYGKYYFSLSKRNKEVDLQSEFNKLHMLINWHLSQLDCRMKELEAKNPICRQQTVARKPKAPSLPSVKKKRSPKDTGKSPRRG